MVGIAVLLAGSGMVNAAASGPTSTPDDPWFRLGDQWGLSQAGFTTAWCRSTGAGALVAVVDTGVTAAHPDLAGRVVGEARAQGTGGDWTKVVSGPDVADDDSGHGTHVSGIVAAATDDGTGIAGAAPGARLYAVKSLFGGTQDETGSADDLAAAIDFVVNRVVPAWPGPVVLNISVGAADASGATSSSTSGGSMAAVHDALGRADAAGVGIALAAGNSGSALASEYAQDRGHALVVGALARSGAVAPYSPVDGVDVFAPGGSAGSDGRFVGGGIISDWLPSSAGSYAWLAGTSMAAPHVAAALALLMSQGLTSHDAYARLLASEDSQHRLRIDTALGATTPCGPPPPRPAPVRRAAAAPPRATATAAPPPPTAVAVPVVAAAPSPPPPSPTPRPVHPESASAPLGGGGVGLLVAGASALLLTEVARRRIRRRDRAG